MAIEIVDFPMKNGDFHSYVSLPEGNQYSWDPQIKFHPLLLGRYFYNISSPIFSSGDGLTDGSMDPTTVTYKVVPPLSFESVINP